MTRALTIQFVSGLALSRERGEKRRETEGLGWKPKRNKSRLYGRVKVCILSSPRLMLSYWNTRVPAQ